jgi:pantothenate kinase-related protein Tda10
MLDQKKKDKHHRPKAKLSYGIQPEELQEILNKYAQEQKTYSREITRKSKRKNIYCLALAIMSIPRSLYHG